MPDTVESPSSIREWVEVLNEQELGAVTVSVQRIQQVLANERSSLQDLSRALQRDPDTTAKVLRVANSPAYLTGGDPVTTVVRASSLMGLDTIRNICVTNRLLEVLLVDHGLPERIRERLLTRIAASLHAAVLARQIVKGHDAALREGIFLAALLDGIGECAFWSSGRPETTALDARLHEPGCDPEIAIRETTGGSFRELSRALVKSWRLTTVLRETREGLPDLEDVIHLCSAFSEALATEGWHSSATRRCVRDIAGMLGIEVDEAGLRLNAWSKLAEELAGCYGVGILGRRMVYRPFEEAARKRAAAGAAPVRAVGTVVNPPRQARALREMSTAARDGKGAMAILQALAEGIEEGLGMERVVVALLTPDRKALQMRIALGENHGVWGSHFRFEQTELRGVFRECLVENRSVLAPSRNMAAPGSPVPHTLMRFATAQDFLLGPVVIGTRAIGAIYCDRAPSGTAIEPEDLEALERMLEHLSALLGGMQRSSS